MSSIKFIPSGVCSKEITISIENGVIHSVHFERGCPGNLHGISSLVVGMTPEEVIKKLGGIDCKGKGTSCPDQLAVALKSFLSGYQDNIA